MFGKFRGGALDDDVMSMMNGFTVLRLFARMNILFSREQLLGINAQLNTIPKPDQ